MISQVKPAISATVTTTIRICEYETRAVKPSIVSRSIPPTIIGGIGLTRAPCVSWTMFCRKIDMPIAEMSGARRVEPRNGRYAVRSTAQP